MTTRSLIRFVRDGEVVEVSDFAPTDTVLDYLRCTERSTGTKEGCCEGDCGACTVAIGTHVDGRVDYVPANSCIQLLGSLDGKELVTVENLSKPGEALHPVQRAMVDNHGSQCGFCTPGFIMSLFVLHQNSKSPTRAEINQYLAGNLCRCTGYKPIIAAARQSFHEKASIALAKPSDLPGDDHDIFIGSTDRFFASPASISSLLALYDEHSDAVLVAGATDVGLWITKQLRDLPKVLFLGRVKELNEIGATPDRLVLGAGVSYANAHQALAQIHGDIGDIINRIGSKQVRALGTVGGNVANGSPIGDMPPMLIALEASMTLRSASASRKMPVEDYFIDYGKQNRKTGEIVEQIEIPRLSNDQRFFAHKISKRHDQDISAVMAAFRFTVKNGTIQQARLAFGGMAGIPKRATHTETALVGLSIKAPEKWRQAVSELGRDFQPLSDMRASADYRLHTAKGLVLKARAQLAGEKNIRLGGDSNAA